MSRSTWMGTAAGRCCAVDPREAGHVAGATAVRRTVESAPAFGITTLTLYAFSSDNWRRPRGEVDNLMFLFQKYLDSECDHADRQRRALQRHRASGPDLRFPQTQHRARRGAHERRNRVSTSGSRSTIRPARRCWRRPAVSPQGYAPTREAVRASPCLEAIHAPSGTRDVDLLIRTGGEQRLSDFLLWESAYAELYLHRRPVAGLHRGRSRGRRSGVSPLAIGDTEAFGRRTMHV